MGDLIAELQRLDKAVEKGAHYGFQQDVWRRCIAALAAKDREIARLREALIAVMNYPDIRVYIGSQVSRFADDALAAKESGNG